MLRSVLACIGCPPALPLRTYWDLQPRATVASTACWVDQPLAPVKHGVITVLCWGCAGGAVGAEVAAAGGGCHAQQGAALHD
eukprot:549229-Prorocentrum_minimum.AAC.5